MQLKIKGNRTIATVIGLIVYLVITRINSMEPDPMIVNGLLGGAVLFTRLGVVKKK